MDAPAAGVASCNCIVTVQSTSKLFERDGRGGGVGAKMETKPVAQPVAQAAAHLLGLVGRVGRVVLAAQARGNVAGVGRLVRLLDDDACVVSTSPEIRPCQSPRCGQSVPAPPPPPQPQGRGPALSDAAWAAVPCIPPGAARRRAASTWGWAAKGQAKMGCM